MVGNLKMCEFENVKNANNCNRCHNLRLLFRHKP
jgi:hypothetical protein